MMRRGTGFHRDNASRKPREKFKKSAAPTLARDDDLAAPIDGVNLKHVFREIDANARDSGQIDGRLAHGRRSI
jgi:hypothetical protein